MRRLVATLATIVRLALPYFRSEDRWPGRLLLGAVIGIELSIVAATAVYTVLLVYQNYLNYWLQIRWRRWMTQTYLRQWLNSATHYRMQLLGDAADNPDQRIADDLQLFVQHTLSIGIGILNSVVTLFSFIVILWTLSEEAPLHLFGSGFAIPGYLVWAALIYAAIGTVLT